MTKKALSYFLIVALLISTITINAKADNKNIKIDGFQISTVYKGFRTLYSIDNNANFKEVGLIYGLSDYVNEGELLVGANSPYIKKFAATKNGISSTNHSGFSNPINYVMTMQYGDNTNFLSEKLCIKAYGIDQNNNVNYSDVVTTSVFDIADYLFKNMLMQNEMRHNFLYDDILKRVDSQYQYIKYDKKNEIITPSFEVTTTNKTTEVVTTKQETTTPKVTEIVTTKQETTTPKATEVVTTKQETTTPKATEIVTTKQETTIPETSEVVPDSNKATGKPGTFTITSDNWEKKNEFNITGGVYWGNNATLYQLFEKRGKNGEYKKISSGILTDDTPNAQRFDVPVKVNKAGTYYYYMVLANKYGKTQSEEISVEVGGTSSSKISLETIDDDGVANSVVTEMGIKEYAIDSTIETSNYEVISSNTDAVEVSVKNNKLIVNAKTPGRSGVKIKEKTSGEERCLGFRVKDASGKVPKLPNYLSLGQVSEDSKDDLSFHKAISTDKTNKRLDMRYIYINGGPIGGWQSWNPADPGSRVRTYVTESLKMGLIPYFVYYNIPDGSESYDVDRNHINDIEYMKAYYKDLKFFLDTAKEYCEGETVGIILEPDFIGYMMQNANATPDNIAAAGVEGAYTSGVLTRGVDPNFENNLSGLIKSINYIINKTYKEAVFGWQFNTWSYSQNVPAKGLMHSTETMGLSQGRNFIENAAIKTAAYYKSAGILEYGAEFISVDKYGLDGAGVSADAASNPEGSSWFWNADLWNNYLYYVSILHRETNKPVTLWQIPVGHINNSNAISPYTGKVFRAHENKEKDYEDSAPTYFFGDTFEPGQGNRLNYFKTNNTNDSKVYANGNKITYGSHMNDAADAGVNCILFGAGVGNSTDAVGNPPTDDYWWITKAQEYYNAPIYFNN